MNADKKEPEVLSAFICVHLRLLFLFLPLSLSANSTNPPLASTGGFSEPSCAQCHNTSPAAPGTLSINTPNAYTPGTQYTLQVTIQSAGASSFGYELSARFTNGSQAGSFPAATGVSVQTATQGGFPVQYASNSSALTSSAAGVVVSLPWTAPPDATGGEIVFNAAAVAAPSSNGSAVGTTFVFSSRAAAGSPNFSVNGVVSAASYQPALAPGQIISLFGQNLTTAGPYTAAGFPLPVRFGPTSLTVNDYSAPLLYVSSSQINAVIPNEVQAGPATVSVQVNSLIRTVAQIQVGASAPALFTAGATGAGAAAILHVDYGVVNAARPAAAGETVLLFATGLGPVSPVFPDGAAATGASKTTLAVTVTMGAMNAPVTYSGLAPGFAGLYQTNATVPSGLSGIVEVRVTAGAVTSGGGVTIQIQ